MRHLTPLKITLAILAGASLQQPLQAARLAYDGFNYTLANDALISGAPATGAGTLGFNAAFVSGNVNFVTAGLSYSGIAPVVGGAMKFDAGDTLTARSWGNATTFPADGTYWYSFLITPKAGGRGTLNIMASTNSTNGQDGFGMRLDNNLFYAALGINRVMPRPGLCRVRKLEAANPGVWHSIPYSHAA
jgi:hypothetical protein